jgi:hypothetical protein
MEDRRGSYRPPALVRRISVRDFGLPVDEPHGPPHRPNPCFFYEPELPLETRLSTLLHADPLRLVTAEGAFTEEFRRPLTFRCRLQVPPNRYQPVRAHHARRLRGRAQCTSQQVCCHTREDPEPAAFRRRSRREPVCQDRTSHIPVKGCTSLDPERLPPCPRIACSRT